MDHIIGELTGLAFVVFIFGGGVIRSILHSMERRTEIRLQNQQGQNDEVLRQITALRQEVAGLRDTSTQFDMALEQTVHRLEQRVAHLEARSPATSEAETVQRVGLR